MSANYGGCPPDGAVVIGIRPDCSSAALAFAVEESCRSGSPLHLVHVLQIGASEGFSGELEGAIEEANSRVQQSLGCARQLVAGAVPVSAERVATGSLVTDLVDRASCGKMLVLEHRRQSRVRRLVSGSTVAGCAARSEVPVVAVPEGWRPSPGVNNVVAVGVQNEHEAEALIRRGIAEAKAPGRARRRDACLVRAGRIRLRGR
jgi:nucleotide-binding universal stress UspA family protein